MKIKYIVFFCYIFIFSPICFANEINDLKKSIDKLDKITEKILQINELILEEVESTGNLSENTINIAMEKINEITPNKKNTIIVNDEKPVRSIEYKEKTIYKYSNSIRNMIPLFSNIEVKNMKASTYTDVLLELVENSSDNCINFQKQAVESYKNKNLPLLQDVKEKIQGENCTWQQKNYIGRQLAYLMYQNLLQGEIKENIVSDLKEILEQYQYFWPALVYLAEYYNEFKKFDLSANYYTKAIDAINDENKTPQIDLPSHTVLKRIIKNSELSFLALEKPFLYRGEANSLMSFDYRIIRTHKKQIPIRFSYGGNKLRGNDLYYASQLYHSLHRLGEPNITLIGHTDPIGSKSYNLRLSEKYSKIIRKYLKSKGYKGLILSRGIGEEEPLINNGNINHYGKARWHRMLRRIEVIYQ